MPYKHPPYESLGEACKHKRAIFGEELTNTIVLVARARALGKDDRVADLLFHVRKSRKQNVLDHAEDLVGFFR
jgi:hypothetical protein